MSMYHDGRPAVSDLRFRSIDVLTPFLGKVWRLWTARRNRHQIARLVQADKRMLADIGITSSDVHMALSAPFGEDPSLTLRRLAGERRAAHRRAIRDSAAELPRSTILVSLGQRLPGDGRPQR